MDTTWSRWRREHPATCADRRAGHFGGRPRTETSAKSVVQSTRREAGGSSCESRSEGVGPAANGSLLGSMNTSTAAAPSPPCTAGLIPKRRIRRRPGKYPLQRPPIRQPTAGSLDRHETRRTEPASGVHRICRAHRTPMRHPGERSRVTALPSADWRSRLSRDTRAGLSAATRSDSLACLAGGA